jgi:hypothetical protein
MTAERAKFLADNPNLSEFLPYLDDLRGESPRGRVLTGLGAETARPNSCHLQNRLHLARTSLPRSNAERPGSRVIKDRDNNVEHWKRPRKFMPRDAM